MGVKKRGAGEKWEERQEGGRDTLGRGWGS